MKLTALALLLVTASVNAQTPPPQEKDPIGRAPIGAQDDIGTPDPLNVMEEAVPPPPEVQTMPEFKDIPPPTEGADGSPSETTGSSNAEAPSEPAAEEPSAVETPAPAPRSRRAEAPPPRELAPDEPDTNREQAFHRIYEKYNAAPTPLESWEQASASRQSETYKVQKTDTLWDLSRTLFGDPNYWPKIWALNSDEVLNPHEIDTWMQIRFYPGDLNEPPTVAVAEAPKAAPAGAQGDQGLIPPNRHVKPLVRKLPKSMPPWKMEAALKELPSFEGVQPRPPIRTGNIYLAYAVSETPVNGVGEIKEAELPGAITASEFQYVFVQVNDPSERIFTVVKDIGTMKDPRRGDDARPVHLIEYQGEIEIIEPVSDRANSQRAIVRKNINVVEVGSKLIPGRLQMVDVTDADPVPGPSSVIIGSQYNVGRRLTDAGGFVFVNAGSAAGFQVGSVVPVFSNVRLRSPNTIAKMNDRQIAHARIVSVTENYATAVLTKVWEEVMVGDTVGGAPVAPILGGGEGEPVPPGALPGSTPSSDDRASATPAPGGDLDFDDDLSVDPSAPAPAPEESGETKMTDPLSVPDDSSDGDLEF